MSPTATKEPPAGETRSIASFYVPWTIADGNSPQVEFHTCSAKNRLMVGSYGSAKSKPLLMEGIFHALEYPGSDSIILRKTIPDLKRTVIDKFLSDVPRWVYQFYHQGDHIVYFHPQPELDAKGKPTGKMLQSKLRFGACEREADVGKYLSTEYVFIGFEELGEFPFAIWDALAGRNRCPIPGSRPCMAAATNPMGIGWSWIKKLWVDYGVGGIPEPGHVRKPKPVGDQISILGMNMEEWNPDDYTYFHSTVDQNPIYRNDKEYIRRLEASPNRDRIRWGKLNAVSGQFFDNWEPTRHVRPMADFIFEDWQPVWVGYDYGFGHYACIVFFTKAVLKPRWEGEKPKRVNVALKELVLHEKTPDEQTKALITAIPRVVTHVEAGRPFDSEEFAYEEQARGNQYGYKWNIESIHFSWERFNRTVSNRTVADDVGDLLQAAGLPLPTRSNTDRVAGWQKMYDLLDTDDFFVIQEGCQTLAEAIPLLVRGDGVTCSIEDIVKPKGLSLNDDIADACRYGIAGTLLDPSDIPESVKLRERLAAIKDPMRRHVEAYKAHIKKQKELQKPPREVIVPTWLRKVRPQ